MNILKIPADRFEEIIISVQKELGITKSKDNGGFNDSVKKLIRPKDFLFNSYIIRDETGLEFRVNRTEGTFSYGTASNVYLRVKAEIGDTPDNVYSVSEVSGILYDQLKKKKDMTNEERANTTVEAVYNIVVPVFCFEHYIMKLMESRAVTITDLSDIQRVTKVNKPQPKKNKKNKSRPSKEITLNFSDIEKVVYAKPEVHVPRSYERHTESWEVRGYVRHYKSGKTVFVKPFTKGKKTEKPSEDKIYNVKL